MKIKTQKIDKEKLNSEIEKLSGQEIYPILKKFVGSLSANSLKSCEQIIVYGRLNKGMTFVFNQNNNYDFFRKWVSINYGIERNINENSEYGINDSPNSISIKTIADNINNQFSNVKDESNSQEL